MVCEQIFRAVTFDPLQIVPHFGREAILHLGQQNRVLTRRSNEDGVHADAENLHMGKRRGETAQNFEHLPIRAGADAYFLSALLNEVIAQGHADQDFIAKHTRDFDQLKKALQPCTVDWAAAHSGIPAQTIRDLARDFGSAESACVYGRTGTCTQRYGTLSNMLMQLLAIVTGNLDSPGGLSFGWGFVDYAGRKMGTEPSRTTGVTDIVGQLGSASLASDITVPGAEQVRALMMVGANPGLAAPASDRLNEALQQLELFFSIDLYINETNRYADYVLPGATMWEREDVPFLAMTGLMLRPSMFATPAVIQMQGEAKEDWEIMYEICRRLGVEKEIATTPHDVIDMIIRNSRFGDKFGEKPEGLTFDKLLHELPNGIKLMDSLPVGILVDKIATVDKRIALAPPQLISEINQLHEDRFFQNPKFPLRLHSMREVLSHNSWMHNAKSLAKSGRTHFARLHADDAKRYGIEDGSDIRIRSPYGEVVVTAKISDKMSPGNVALPHGWGHQGGWQVANDRGGVNSNRLASADPKDTDRLSGSSVFNGIPIQIAVA